MQVNNPLTQPKVETSTPTVAPKQSDSVPQTEPKTLEQRKEAFKTKESTLIDASPQTTEQIKTQIEQAPSQEIAHQAKFLPSLTELAIGKAALKHVNTVDKTMTVARQEYVQDTQNLSDTTIQQKDVQRVVNNANLGELKTPKLKQAHTDFTRALMKASRENDPVQFLKDNFTSNLHDLDKADTVFGAKQKIAGVVDQTQLKARNMVANLSKGHDLSLLLSMKSDQELEVAVTQMLAELKGYDSGDLSQLSTKKQQFIQAIVTGIKEGLQNQQVGPKGELAVALDSVKEAAQEKMATYDHKSDMAWTIALKPRDELKTMLTESMGVMKDTYFNALIDGLKSGLPNRASDNRVTVKKGVESPETIMVNGKTYASPKYVAEGGFADIVRYTNPNNPQDTVIIKQLKTGRDDMAALRKEAVDEVNAHREILGTNGHKNIIDLKGVANDSSGNLFMVLEDAPYGDIGQINHNMNTARDKGLVSQDIRQLMGLYLFRGQVSSMQHIQSERGAHHNDHKLPNMLLGSDGELKNTDFGLSGTGLETQFGENDAIMMNDNPKYKSPDLLNAQRKIYKEGAQQGNITAKSDTWNVGVAGHELIFGDIDKFKWGGSFMSPIEKEVTTFGQEETSRIRPTGTMEDDSPGMGVSAIDKLLNGLMHPQPDKRITMEAALKNSVFQDSRLDSPAMKELVKVFARVPEEPAKPSETPPKKPAPFENETDENYQFRLENYQKNLEKHNLQVAEYPHQLEKYTQEMSAIKEQIDRLALQL